MEIKLGDIVIESTESLDREGIIGELVILLAKRIQTGHLNYEIKLACQYDLLKIVEHIQWTLTNDARLNEALEEYRARVARPGDKYEEQV